MKKSNILVIVAMCLLQINVMAQFTLSGEIRPRAEYRHGWRNLPATNQDPAFFIDQRSRLNFEHISEKLKMYITLQDVRVWGNQSQMVTNDGALTSLHEAWAEYKFSENFSTKMGRQEINLDDQRIFGAVAWTQQARSHDAALVNFSKGSFKAQMGLAYNQDTQQSTTTYYTVANSYKTFQYLWLNYKMEKLGISALFLNNGMQGGVPFLNNDKTYYTQTIGTRATYKGEGLFVNGTVYYQAGTLADGNTNVSGLLYSVEAGYTLSKKHTFIANYESISGNDQINPDTKNRAFTPYYGTNHKFNGLMDYFYVGNHTNSVGLNDLNLTYKGMLTEPLTLTGTYHYFMAAGGVEDPTNPGTAMDANLGSEIDISLSYKVSKELTISGGYSQMFGTDTLVILRGGDTGETSNWAWLMFTFKPTFFTTKEEEQK
ncbi:MAG: alginate export family protein [Cyclobacteriaceae bacterium]|nr:alginate export family protein [Cyclobacteriaceae bacterium]